MDRDVDKAAGLQAPAGDGPWRLYLLGRLDLTDAKGHERRWPSRTAARLLARLALAPQRVHPREELVELLWPGVAHEVGRNRLRQVLSTLKSLLESDGAEVIEADRHGLRLRPGRVWCDATTFEQQVRAGRPAQARALYVGELMPGVFDEWVQDARAPLATLAERLDSVPEPAPAPHEALPAGWTRVFGLEPARRRLIERVQAHRLVTVVGPGGCGKTRLALETARQLQTASGGARFERVAFIALVDCRTEAHALTEIARELQLGSGDALRQAAIRLAGQRVLLVLDNFEQLAASAAALPMALLEALPALHLLVTSRLRVGWPGEQVFTLEGLPLPAADADMAELGANPAVALYLDRARAVASGFASEADDLPAVAELVRRLDGMPLALELAASRVVGFPPPRVLELLDAGHARGMHLQLLTRATPRSGRDARHASIAEVIDWSWQLLSGPAQAVLRALAAATGDLGPAALAAMLAQDTDKVRLQLDELAAHSMLRRLQDERVTLLEPVREFVRLRSADDDLQRLQLALQAWLLQWARKLQRSLAAGVVESELHHVHAALANPGPDAQLTLHLALALRPHWESSGMPLALQQPLETALQRHDQSVGAAPDALSSVAHELLAYLRFEAGFTPEARRHADAALARAGNEASLRAGALVRLAWLDLAAGRSSDTPGTRAEGLRARLDEALALARSAGDREAEARALHQLAVLTTHLYGDWVETERLLEQSQHLWQALGDRRKALARLRNRAQAWVHLGRVNEARACFEHCARVASAEGDTVGRIDSLLSLSTLLATQRQWTQALQIDRECVQLCWQHWHRHGLAYALWNPPLALARLRRPAEALQLMAFAATFWESTFGPLALADRQTVRRVRRLARAQLGGVAAEVLWTEGATMPIAQAVALALQAPGPLDGAPPARARG